MSTPETLVIHGPDLQTIQEGAAPHRPARRGNAGDDFLPAR